MSDPVVEGFRLSPQQRRLWDLGQGSQAYCMQRGILLEGPLREEALERAIGDLVRRYEILRTRFRRIPGLAAPLQVVSEDGGFVWRRVTDDAAIDEILDDERRKVAELDGRAQLHAVLVPRGPDRSVLVVTVPTLCADAETLEILTVELAGAYAARCDGSAVDDADEDVVQYAQYAEWQNQLLDGGEPEDGEEADENREAGLAYWRERAPAAVEPSRLPFTRPPSGDRPFAPRAVERELDRSSLESVRDEDLDEEAFLLACWGVLLWRMTGRSPVVGILGNGRSDEELLAAVGPCARYLPLRCGIESWMTLRQTLQRLEGAAGEALDWQDYFAWPAARPQSRTAPEYLPCAFEYSSRRSAARAAGVAFSCWLERGCHDRFLIKLSCSRRGERVFAELHHDPELLDGEHAERLAAGFDRIVTSAARRGEAKVGELEILGDVERELLVATWNETAAEPPAASSVVALFRRAARAHPDVIAVVHEDAWLTYATLDEHTDRLARALVDRRVGAETRVGLCVARTPEFVVGLLAVMKAGGAYVPLDPVQPRRRVAAILREAGARIVLSAPPWDVDLSLEGIDVLRLDRDPEPSTAFSPSDLSPASLAYVMFTSGSTGRPKGVGVEHRQLLGYVDGILRRLETRAGASHAMISTVAADLGNTALFPALCTGGTLHLISEERAFDPRAFAEYCEQRSLDYLKIVPSHLAAMRLAGHGAAALPRRGLILGGEASNWELVESLRQDSPGCRIVNHYGPTEATVGCLTFEVGSERREHAATVPIGNPLPRTRAYVCSENLALASVGVPGELWVGGPSLARGYVGDPVATAWKFLPDPYAAEPGSRLYRTGDLCRRLPDGAIEFLGRTDHQVKIRGFRVELGEVEAVLREVEGVRDCVVVLRRDEQRHARLVGYVVSGAGVDVSIEGVRQDLAVALPDYMIPAQLVKLDALPLTPNGKVDRSALPAPVTAEVARSRRFVAPRTDAERELAEIWTGVLRTEEVGVRDNFFELGGDSILSIQVVARAHRAGLRLSPHQLFQHPTIEQLAAVAGRPRTIEAEQGAVTGPLPLTPIQRWFFEQELAAQHHWNMALLLDVRTPLEPVRLRAAVEELLSHEDALRLRFERRGKRWTQRIAEPDPAETDRVFRRVDLAGVAGAGRAEALTATVDRLQSSLDLVQGPLIRVALLELEPQVSRLLIVVHHLAMDGVSWRILLEDLLGAYELSAPGATLQQQQKTTSLKAWSEHLARYAEADEVAQEIPYWTELCASDVARLPIDYPDGINDAGSVHTVAVELDEPETRELLEDVPAVYRTRIQEVLMTALALALGRWTGGPGVLVDLEGHGREDLFENVDVSRTLGWFTTHYPVRLVALDSEDPAAALRRVKESMRQVPRQGIGFGVLRYLRGDRELRDELRRADPQLSFNYLGQLDRILPEQAPLTLAPEPAGSLTDPAARRAHLVEVSGGVAGGRLQTFWSFSTNVHRSETIERVAGDFIGGLRELIAHCRSPEAGGYTPSDFPLAGLGQLELDRLLGKARGIEDVYPLSPLQAGMLFHGAYTPGRDIYFQQFTCVFQGDLNATALRRAWERVVQRHSVLRTRFIWAGLEEPLQVVHRDVELPWEEADWTDDVEGERTERFEVWLDSDRQRGFALDRAPLMRVALLRIEKDAWRFVWSHHHALLDGWSLPLLLGELMMLYEANARGLDVPLEPARPYRDYIDWLRRQDPSEAQAYWTQSLRGFTEPTPLRVPRAEPVAGEDAYPCRQTGLSAEATAELDSLARRHGLTLNTVVQGAWALLLASYSGESDVVFGATVSGRSAPLPGIESMMGLLINALPVRVRVDPARTLKEWLMELQAEQATTREHEFSSLVDVQGWSEVPRGAPLFETLLVFENYPVDRSMEQQHGISIAVRDIRYPQRTNYPVTVVALPGPALVLQIWYERRSFDDATIDRMLAHFVGLLRGIVDPGVERVADVSMLSSGERSQLLTDLAVGPAGGGAERCAHEQVLEQAKREPDRIAVVADGVHLSYGALRRQVLDVASRLVELGVAAETRVGIAVERDPSMVVGLLGILASGACYVPLDPDHPQERLQFMLEDAGVSLLVTTREASARSGLCASRMLYLDDGSADGPPEESTPATGVVTKDQLAYVIYTSGSTGRPKGVAVPHGALSNFLESMRREPGLASTDVLCAVTTLGFDISGLELLLPLVSGGCVELATRGTASDGERLSALLARSGATVMQATPATWSLLVGSGWEGRAGLKALCGGEALGRDLADRLLDRVETLWNVYGPTETTIWSTVSLVRRGGAEVPIGRPIARTTVYVLDGELEPVPVGVSGKLYIGGAGLSRGYLGRAGLTASSFVPDDLGGEAGGRLYDTGDLARWREDGTLEYLGRVDAQVKLRGFRIEPGEIEATLREHPAVGDAVVTAREDRPGGRRLVAYVVGYTADRPPELELSDWLRSRLPDYMVPSAWVVIDRLPVGPAGKIDRRALPAPDALRPEVRQTYLPPRTSEESELERLWCEVLGVDRVGVRDDFFELGGHSLTAMQLASRARAVFRVNVPVSYVFEAPTIEGLAARLASGSRHADEEPLVRVPRDEELPLSFAQQRLWFLDQLMPGHAFYNVPRAVRLEGKLDARALARTVDEIVERHETLRTTFPAADGRARQVIAESLRLRMPVIDLRGLPAALRAAEMRRLAVDEAARPFDLAQGPLIRLALLRMGDDEHVVLLTMHHIVSDGWSMGVFVREVAALYPAFVAGRGSMLPRLPLQYVDFARWQRRRLAGGVLDEHLAYWTQRLADVEPVQLPTDRPRPAVQSYRGATRPCAFRPGIGSELEALGRREGVTPFMTLLAVFQVLLARYTGQRDVTVGSPIANRTRAEVEPLIGFFVNSLVLRTDLAGDPSFASLLSRVREVCLGAYAHQDLPFEKLVEEMQPERDLSREPLFQVMLVLQNAAPAPLAVPGGLTIGGVEVDPGTSKFDMTLTLWTEGADLAGVVEYATDLFEESTILRLQGHLQRLLEAVAEDPGRPISELPMLASTERTELLVERNATDVEHDVPERVHEWFAEQVRRTPDRTAVVFGDEHVSYRALERRAAGLSARLVALGVEPDVRVGISVERSTEMLVGVLGILGAGGAYVPLDPEYPTDRLGFMMRDSAVAVLVTQDHLRDRLPEGSATVVVVDDVAAAEEPSVATGRASGDRLAYVIYTSGSTGIPKGVGLQHSALGNLVAWHASTLGRGMRTLQFASLSFDASFHEMFATWCTGGTLFVVEEDDRRDIPVLAAFLLERAIGKAIVPVVVLQHLAEERTGAEGLSPHLRELITTGEQLQLTPAVRRFFERMPSCTLHNHYGPSETHVVTAFTATGSPVTWPGHPPIGRPIANTQVYVLDAEGNPTPQGAPGELYLGGRNVARCYLDRPALTAERFVPDPFAADTGARLYRTGDLVRWSAEAELEFLGRIDQQIKVRGFRVEPGEVEALLLGHPSVDQAVVAARPGPTGDLRLVAWVVPNENEEARVDELQRYLADRLPAFMVPSAIQPVGSLPLSPTGKVDRKALPEPERMRSGRTWVAPRGPVEQELARLWAGLLGGERVGAHDSFFELGGHSLLATQLISRVRTAFQVELPLRALFEAPTIAGLAETIASAGDRPQSPPIRRVPRDRPLVLSFGQQRLFFLDRLTPGTALYNVPAAVRLTGSLDVRAFERALRQVIDRHEVLRTAFVEQTGSPVAVVGEAPEHVINFIDLGSLPEARREGAADDLTRASMVKPFELSVASLFRSLVIRLDETSHVVSFVMHHITSDAWSLGVLIREVAALYGVLSRGLPARLPELPIQYADFAAWQREWLAGDVLKAQLAFWRGQLGDVPVLRLPTDRPRSPAPTFRGRRERVELPPELSASLKEMSDGEGTTLFMTLLAAFQLLLFDLSGQDDVATGTNVANRNRAETEPLIGFFVNQLVLRTDLSGDPTWRELLHRVRRVTLDGYEHQDLPFEKIVEELQPRRDPATPLLFQAKIDFQQAGEAEVSLDGLIVRPIDFEFGVARQDLHLSVTDTPQGLIAAMVYAVDLFDAPTARSMLADYERLLHQVVEQPGARLSALRRRLTELREAHLLEEAPQRLLGNVRRRPARLPGDRRRGVDS